MTPRHAAALVLVGWYLMLPPLGADHSRDDIAPISRWRFEDSLDSAAECRDTLLRRWSHAEDEKVKDAYLKAACVSTDDPRLKEK